MYVDFDRHNIQYFTNLFVMGHAADFRGISLIHKKAVLSSLLSGMSTIEDTYILGCGRPSKKRDCYPNLALKIYNTLSNTVQRALAENIKERTLGFQVFNFWPGPTITHCRRSYFDG